MTAIAQYKMFSQLLDSGAVFLHHVDGRTVSTFIPSANTDAARGLALTAAFNAHSAGESIFLAPCLYQVAAPLTVLSGVLVQGMGMGVTAIKIADQGSGVFTREIYVINNGLNFALNGTVVRGITCDCNVGGQSSSTAVIGGVQLYGTGCWIDSVEVINFSTKLLGAENFLGFIGSLQGGGLNGPAYGNKILNCRAHSPALVTWADGGTAFGIAANGMTGTNVYTPGGDAWQIGPEITGCTVNGVTVGTGSGQPAYFHAFGVGFTLGAKVHHNSSDQLLSSKSDGTFTDSTGFYVDTGSNFGLQLCNNSFTNVVHGVWVKLGNGSHYLQTDCTISDNYITTLGASNKGIEFSGDHTNPAINLWVTDNRIILASGQVALQVQDITGLFVQNNIFDTSAGSPIKDVNPGSVTVIKQRFNYKKDGTVISADFAPTAYGS